MTDPSRPHDFAYVHTDIPAGMTIAEWRAERARRQKQLREAHRSARHDRLRASLAAAVLNLTGAVTGSVRFVRDARPGSPSHQWIDDAHGQRVAPGPVRQP